VEYQIYLGLDLLGAWDFAPLAFFWPWPLKGFILFSCFPLLPALGLTIETPPFASYIQFYQAQSSLSIKIKLQLIQRLSAQKN
jgi:hypothetical protein